MQNSVILASSAGICKQTLESSGQTNGIMRHIREAGPSAAMHLFPREIQDGFL